MRRERSMDLVLQLLAGSNHPDIKNVEYYDEDGAKSPAGISVLMVDGTNVRLRCVRSSGPGGDSFNTPEHLPYPDYKIPEEVNENVPSLQSVRGR